jgi:hypothetical protein
MVLEAAVTDPTPDYDTMMEIRRLAMFWRMFNGGHRCPEPVITDYVADWGSGHRGARFNLDGAPMTVTYHYEGGGDRAYWDDGWWPSFFAVTRERYGLFPWKRERQVPV